MNEINIKELINKKKSDTIVIYGCGWSINDLTKEEKQDLERYDSIGFNYFCKSGIPTTFYILREQSTKKNKYKDEDPKLLISQIKNNYKNSCLLFINMLNSGHCWKGKRGWIPQKQIFNNDRIILNETYFEALYKKEFPETPDPNKQLICNSPKMQDFCNKTKQFDIDKNGILYYSCTISLALHLSIFLKYKKIIFVGVDLYDHRYFWLPKNTLREQTRKKGRKIDQKHKTHKFTCNWAKESLVVHPEIDKKVKNKKSLLSSYFPVY